MTLTVVIPAYNEERTIAETIRSVELAARQVDSLEVEIVVVDDGSSDGTAAAAAAAAASAPLRVVSQPNQGRFLARRTGLEAARGEFLLFLDARVTIDSDALRFVEERVRRGERVWNAHCDIETDGNQFALFWRALTELVFAEYFSDPRTTSFDASTFDRFPKGTTCFLAPRETLAEAFRAFHTSYDDVRYANDDTPIIRWIAGRMPIHISPGFRCLYRPRTTPRGFARHAFHRGIVFLDGHGRRESRFFPFVAAFYPLSVACALLVYRRPLAAPVGAAALGATSAAVAFLKGRPADEVAALARLSPLYAVAHGVGMWRGFLLRARAVLRAPT